MGSVDLTWRVSYCFGESFQNGAEVSFSGGYIKECQLRASCRPSLQAGEF